MTNIQNFHHVQNVPNMMSDLRAAYGPGFQLAGPTEASLRAVTSPKFR